jgi:two-component system cell cycle response regulator CpdR
MSTRLLIIDDDVDLCCGLADLLSEAGHTVETASDGPDGLSKIEKDGYDVVLIDIKLPGMDGIEFLKHLRDRRPKARIFIMSGAPDAEERAAAGGVSDMISGVIRKPFDIDALLEAVGGAS